MNTHAPDQQACNKQAMTEQWALFTLQSYGSLVSQDEHVVSIPYHLQYNEVVQELINVVRAHHWHVQIGVL